MPENRFIGIEPDLRDFKLRNTNGHEAFAIFLENCKNQLGLDDNLKNGLEEQAKEFCNQKFHLGSEILQFRTMVRQVPIAAALIDWAKNLFTDPFWSELYENRLLKLQKSRLIPLMDEQGRWITLEYFMSVGHLDILENIRCFKEWSIFEKEEIIQCYLQFSRSLSKETHDIIPEAIDPDRELVRNKLVKFEIFIEFVRYLSSRDALIAKLLYFGSPSLDEVIELKEESVDLKNYQIHFKNVSIRYPKHVIQDLGKHFEDRRNGNGFVFNNVRGEFVDRAHLNHAFLRATHKSSSKTKITPGSLLKQIL